MTTRHYMPKDFSYRGILETEEQNDIVNEIQAVRADNNNLWMQLLRMALIHSPNEAKACLRDITKNDMKISKLTSRLAE